MRQVEEFNVATVLAPEGPDGHELVAITKTAPTDALTQLVLVDHSEEPIFPVLPGTVGSFAAYAAESSRSFTENFAAAS